MGAHFAMDDDNTRNSRPVCSNVITVWLALALPVRANEITALTGKTANYACNSSKRWLIKGIN